MPNPEKQSSLSEVPEGLMSEYPDINSELVVYSQEDIEAIWQHLKGNYAMKNVALLFSDPHNTYGTALSAMSSIQNAEVSDIMAPGDVVGPFMYEDDDGVLVCLPDSVAVYGKTS